jgi:uncharacterized protein YbjT (DUF2867 family)
MQAWIVGATGLVGRSLVEQSLGEDVVEKVTALVRRQALPRHPKLEERVVDFAELGSALSGHAVTHAFSCLGTTMAKAKSEAAFRQVDFEYPLAFARAARQAGAQCFVSVSSIGANSGSRVFYNRVKGELEDALSQIDFPSLHILRPSLLEGDRDEPRFGERLAQALGRPLGHLLFGSLRKYRPIAAEDVAKAMLHLAQRPQHGRFVHESDAIFGIASNEAGKGR